MTKLEYRAYSIGPDGHITQRVDLFCGDDESAQREAQQLVLDHEIELWLGARKVATFPLKVPISSERSLGPAGATEGA